jgi:hypothetical protein
MSSLGYGIVNTRRHYSSDGLHTVHAARFLSNPRFRAAYARGIQASKGFDPHFEWRVHIALTAAETALRVPGDFIECGVNAGFLSSAILNYLDWNSTNRRYYLIDTFAGPVLEQFSEEEIRRGRSDIARDALAAGAYVNDLPRVLENFSEWPGGIVTKGVIPEILLAVPVDRVAFLHIDLNCAAPERAALEHFWDSLSPGGLVLLDDYAYYGHDCQADVIDDAARKLGASLVCLPTGQGLIVR